MQSGASTPPGLYRRDGWLFGVCGGIAQHWGFSAFWLRVVWLISIFFTGGTMALVYIVLVFVMKRPPRYWDVAGERVR
jgi:phage shock protein C